MDLTVEKTLPNRLNVIAYNDSMTENAKSTKTKHFSPQLPTNKGFNIGRDHEKYAIAPKKFRDAYTQTMQPCFEFHMFSFDEEKYNFHAVPKFN